jgi:hypothetical protein
MNLTPEIIRHRNGFSRSTGCDLCQDEAIFFLEEGNRELKRRFRDYNEISNRRGLYERVFYDRLNCAAPKKVGETLNRALDEREESSTELRVTANIPSELMAACDREGLNDRQNVERMIARSCT